MKTYLAVGIGGVIGSSLRYILSLLFLSDGFSTFPWATLTVNLTGAFLLPFIMFHPAIKVRMHPIIGSALTTGLIGSYTTFSTITVEVVHLFQKTLFLAIIYLLVTIFGGLFCSFLGYRSAQKFAKEEK